MPSRDASQSPAPAPEFRTNDVWLAALRSDDGRGHAAQRDLRSFIRRGLGRALTSGPSVDDATLDDFTQDAMVRITTRLDDFRGESRLTTWAMAIAIRVAYTALRRKRWSERSLDDVVGSEADTLAPAREAAIGRDELLGALREAIDRDLTPRQRAAILGELAGMPTAVLAEQLETNANALYKLHHDARLRLKGALDRRGFSENDVRGIVEGASKD